MVHLLEGGSHHGVDFYDLAIDELSRDRGTMSLAHGLRNIGLHCVGVPKTIDNDIASCERSFGFDSAATVVSDALGRLDAWTERPRIAA